MDTLTIQLTNNKAYKLLKDMEDLQLIRVLKENENAEKVAEKIKPAATFRGSLHLTDEQYKDFQQHATDIRNEWNSNI